LIKYIKSVLWRVVKRLSYIQDARCLKVNVRWLLHVSVYDHHQGACNWASLKLCWH